MADAVVEVRLASACATSVACWLNESSPSSPTRIVGSPGVCRAGPTVHTVAGGRLMGRRPDLFFPRHRSDSDALRLDRHEHGSVWIAGDENGTVIEDVSLD
jgi:hypothetical protein